MTKEQALNYLKSSGFSKEQIQAIVEALSSSDNLSSGTRKNSKKLEKGTAKNDFRVDCISRAYLLDDSKYHTVFNDDTGNFEDVVYREDIEKAPSVTPQEPKMGYWKAFIHNAYHGTDEDGEPIWREVTVYHCSQCNRRTVIKEKFCPSCGSDNREVVEE
jgi:hypothetical protein